jgi:HD-like signal output (HDOD) protein
MIARASFARRASSDAAEALFHVAHRENRFRRRGARSRSLRNPFRLSFEASNVRKEAGDKLHSRRCLVQRFPQDESMSLAGQRNVTLPDNFSIPTLPTVVHRIGQLLQDPNVGMREVANVVAEDAALAAKVLKIANSAFYGLRTPCISTQQAATVLGLRVLRSVIMQASVIRQYDHLAHSGFDVDGLWKSSIATAQACHFIARRCKKKLEIAPEELYVCGLLHNLGQIVLLDNLKERYIEIAREAELKHMPVHVVELQHLGYDHTDVGHKVATTWGLPPAVVAAIQFHHGPQDAIDREAVIGLAARTDALVHRVHSGQDGRATPAIDGKLLSRLGATVDDAAALVEFVSESLQTVEI